MYVHLKSSLFALSLILLIGQQCSAWLKLDDFLESQHIDDQLTLLTPEALLKNRPTLQEKDHYNANDPCNRDLILYERAVHQRQSWALKMLDASSKLPTGIFHGNYVEMGMFDECLEVHGRLDDIEIRGRHCMYSLNRTLKLPFIINPTLSICLPATCSAEYVTDLLRNTINATELLKDLGVNAASVTCEDLLLEAKNVALIVFLIVVMVNITFLVFCTICEIANRKFEKNLFGLPKNLERFSLLKNIEKIFSTKTRDSELSVIHGIRAIACCWIVFVHQIVITLLGVHSNFADIVKYFSSWSFMYVTVGLLSVDTFLALSGFLMAHNFFKEIRKTHKFNVLSYYLHRYIRLTSPVAFIIIFALTVASDFESGPRCDFIKSFFVTGCVSKWWTVLLYIQNFYERNNYCLQHLWSLSVDMQLYWLSPCILYPLYKRPKLGLTLLTALIFASAIVSGSIVGMNDYSGFYLTHDFNYTKLEESFQFIYVMPYTRASPWLIGVLFGYAVVHKGTTPNKVLISTGWILAIASFVFCIFGLRSLVHENYEYKLVQEVTYATLQRPLWAFGICWIIYTSTHNVTGLISSFLSAKIFLPISRLSYSIYLVHLVLPVLEVVTLRTPKYFNQYSLFQSFISNMLLSILLALALQLIVQEPTLILEDIFIKRKQINSKETDKAE